MRQSNCSLIISTFKMGLTKVSSQTSNDGAEKKLNDSRNFKFDFCAILWTVNDV